MTLKQWYIGVVVYFVVLVTVGWVLAYSSNDSFWGWAYTIGAILQTIADYIRYREDKQDGLL